MVALLTTSAMVATGLQAQDQPEDPDRWKGEVGLSVNGSGGNERLTVITGQLGLAHLETNRYELDFNGRARYGRSEGVEVARSVRGSLSAEFRPAARLSPFLSGTAEHDRFRRVDLRMNTGAGFKHTFWREGWSDVSLSGALLYWYEQLARDDSDGPTHTARWSWRGRARHRLDSGARLEQTVFYQPTWERLDDYVLEAQTTVRLALSQSLSLNSSFLYQRDSTPAPEVAPDDWSIAVGLSLATTW